MNTHVNADPYQMTLRSECLKAICYGSENATDSATILV